LKSNIQVYVNILMTHEFVDIIRSSPFWCFPFEAMEAFTYHTMWIAAATYCSELAPKGLLATLMGVMGSLHYGLGNLGTDVHFYEEFDSILV